MDVVEACARVLAPHGSMCIELGDTYASDQGRGPDWTMGGERFTDEGLRAEGRDGGENGQPTIPGRRMNTVSKYGTGWPLPKSLSLIPELFRLTLVYGVNPLTGRQTERWRLRNVVRWVRPNPPVGALGDKFRPATSELMVFCKSAKRYFDLDAVREPYKGSMLDLIERGRRNRDLPDQKAGIGSDWTNRDGFVGKDAGGAPPLDWWNIPPGGYEGAHYAVFPPELCVKPIKAMCPEKVCRVCGEPSRRIVEVAYMPSKGGGGSGTSSMDGGQRLGHRMPDRMDRVTADAFSDCGHDDWRPGLVLDPFGGSGTTALVATGHGRDCILIDLDERNFELALQRVGPFILERAT